MYMCTSELAFKGLSLNRNCGKGMPFGSIVCEGHTWNVNIVDTWPSFDRVTDGYIETNTALLNVQYEIGNHLYNGKSILET